MVKIHIPKTKCDIGGCEHNTKELQEETHEEAVCWKITQPDYEALPTEKKYCPCKREKGLIRRFALTRFMEAQPDDMMVTKLCRICGKSFLLRYDQAICRKCLGLTFTA